jgi:hypothetical protein
MEKLSVSSRAPPQPSPSDKPVVLAEHGILYLWDMDAGQFKRQGEVEASIIENGDADCESRRAFLPNRDDIHVMRLTRLAPGPRRGGVCVA